MADTNFDNTEDKLRPKVYIEDLYNYISYLDKYFNLIVDTDDAEGFMKQEVDTETYQRNRCVELRNTCVKIYTDLYNNFNLSLINLGNTITIELEKRNDAEQKLLHQKITNLFKEIEDRIRKRINESGFSEESIGKKFKKKRNVTKEGDTEEIETEYNFTTGMLVYDLVDKLNQLLKLINRKFKYIFTNSHPNTTASIPDTDIEENPNDIKSYIENEFQSIKERCFDTGYNTLIALLTSFFEGKEYTIPLQKIQLKARCKTKIAPIFNKIYMQKKSGMTPLKSDKKYFEIIRVLNHFKDLSDNEIYKIIGR